MNATSATAREAQKNMAPGRILIVEDDSAIRDTLKDALEFEGYTVRVAENGLEAFSALAAPPLPDLILLDLLMPKMSGWEFVEVLRKDPASPMARIPVVVASAMADRTSKMARSVQAVLKKPLELDELFEVVQRLCASKL